jgi:protocatechuate 3,4-dioxygenase beta subunit
MKTLSKKGLLAILFVVLFGTLINSCDDSKPLGPEPTQTSELQGVLENEFNEAIPYAQIDIIRTSYGKTTVQEDKIIASDTTDEDGNYSFKKLPDDFANLIFRVKHPDLQPFQVNLAEFVKGKDKKNANVNVQCKSDCCGEIEFKVVSDDSTVIAGAVIKLYQRNDYKRKAMTDKDGIHIFEKVCEGEYWARIYKSGYKVREVTGINVKGCDDNDKVYLTVFLTKENQNDPDCKGVLKVNVKDKENGNVLNDALVKLMKDGNYVGKAYSKNGVATFDGLCEGEYKVIVTAKGYNTEDANVKLDKDEEKEITVELEKNKCCEGVMEITVLDDEKNPIEKAEVRLWQNGNKLEVGVTNSKGLVVFEELCEGVYAIDIQKNGYESIEFKEKMPCNETVKITKTLKVAEKCKGQVKINIQDENENALAGAEVYLYHKNTKVGVKTTDKLGNVLFEELCEGPYFAKIFKKQYQVQEFDFYLKNGETKEFEKKMQPADDSSCTGVVEVFVSDEQGNSLQYVMVSLWKGNKKIGLTKTNADGKAVFDGLCEGQYQISMSLKGYKGQEFSFSLAKDGYESFQKQLVKDGSDSCCNGQIKVYVKDENDNALKYVIGKLYLNNKKVGYTKSNADGVMTFSKICKGEYVLELTKDGYKEIEMKVEVGCDETVEINKTMQKLDSCCTAILKLMVMSEDQKQIAGADVEVYLNGTKIKTGQTNNDGHWYADDLCAPATYVVVVKKDGYKDQEFEVKYDWCTKYMTKVVLKK